MIEAYRLLEMSSERQPHDGVVVERMAPGRLEVIVGGNRDPEFGKVIVFGSGGSLAEYRDDSALALARYLDSKAGQGIVCSTGVGKYLSNRSPDIISQLGMLLERLAGWFMANPQLISFDLNPVIIDPDAGTLLAVDARVA